MFHAGKIDIVSQLLSGNFPDHKLVKKSIGKATTTITMSTVDLFRACRQLKIFTVEKGSGSSLLDVTGTIVRYSITTQDKGDADVTLSAMKEGKDISIGINVHLLYQFLETCKTEQVRIEFSTKQAPILLAMDGYKNFWHVIMPVVL
jgi:DNA polymerase III sliding clamp (beta) subunit (PCNA family)